MRIALVSVAFCVSCFVFAVAAPVESDNPDLRRIEAAQDRRLETWQGRRHFLYDDEYTPKTDGAATANSACAKVPVRVQSSDGKTAVKRINRCD
jgi:hypothetical protein